MHNANAIYTAASKGSLSKEAAKRYGSRAAILSICDQGVASLSNFAAVFCLARFSTPRDLGIYALLFTIYIFLISVEHSLITAPYTCYYPRKQAQPTYTGSVLLHHACFAGISSTALFTTG